MSNYNIYIIRVSMDYGYCQDIIEVRRRARSYKEATARACQLCDKILANHIGEAVKLSIVSIFEEG